MIGIDTNILVYAFDTAYPQKRARCKRIVEGIFSGEREGAVTNQILAEFSVTVTRKIEKPLPRNAVRSIVASILLSTNWTVFAYDGHTVLRALDRSMDFWDALISCTFEAHGVRTIITENTKDFTDTSLNVRSPF